MNKDQPRSKAWESTIRKAQLQRRGCSIFSTMSVAPCDDADSSMDGDEEHQPGEVYHVERLLANGDFYMGLWSGDRPHGTGKYLWTDGCMYEGEWQHGKTVGKGKFSWPSGASYEGEFKSGFLDGFGSFTGASGDTYRGYYAMNLKNGHGRRTYTNGDYYDGEWRFGLQDGQGRYIWKNGHDYNGIWKAGAIHGKGILVWANGNCYDGEWEEGAPCGKGQFRWADGSLYVGTWSKDNPDGSTGVYFPSASSSASPEHIPRDPQDDLDTALEECKICPGESLSILPSQKSIYWPPGGENDKQKGKLRRRASADAPSGGGQVARRTNNSNSADCIWESDGNVTGDIVDGTAATEPVTPERLSGLRLEDGEPKTARSLPMKWVPREMKKQGETISKGHKNYELMLNLQLGIRYSVGRPAPATSLDLKSAAFDPKEKVWTRFPPEGSKHTPPHQSCDFKWKDYCPVVFRTLRKLFKVDPADYMLSICGNDALRELSSPGKSGSFFYLTHDDRYMIKTMKKSEVKVLLRMLPAYYNHVRAFEHTLVTKFYGLHCVKLTGATQKKVRFVIMGNLFCSEFVIHRRFDLKGSSHGRTTDKPEAEIDENTTLKDLDLNFLFRLQRCWFQEFLRQVDRDCELLEQERIMDYSLLVGLHFREASGVGAATPRVSKGEGDDPNIYTSTKLGINMPARVELTVRKNDIDNQLMIGEPTGECYDVILFFGIIDILQDYDISKKLEHAYKSIQYDPTSISAVDPRQYARRFRDFIFRVFTEDS